MAITVRKRNLLLAVAALCFCLPAAAIDYRSVGDEPAVLYDAPSTKANPVSILGPGYPVEVLVALDAWTKVRDGAGELAWIEARRLSSRRTVMVRVPRAEVRQGADESSPIVFFAEQDVLLELVQMEGNYARVRHRDGTTGFIRVTHVWGL